MTLDVGGVARGLLTWDKQEHLVKLAILILAAVLSFATRLFSVLRFESVIHEFDPYFNYRTTRFLAEQGFYKFHNWFDDRAWYPLGRIIGGTIYPGLMLTSAALYRLMWLLNVTIDIRNVCVFLAPFFSSLTTLVTYALTKEIHSTGAGLVAAALISIVPGYISRSAVKTGTIFWSAMSALAYFYMVSSWGGYVFLINLIPLHVLALMITGRFSHRIYIAYSTLYCVGTILSMQISFVGFQPIQSSEHMLEEHWDLWLCQIHAFVDYLRSRIPKDHFDLLFKTLVSSVLTVVFVVGTLLTLTGKVSPWTGRFYSLLDPSYAKNHIPIIASVSEHQPTSWSSFYFDLQILVFLFPAGLYFCFSKLTDSNIFIILYGVTSIYFAGVMVRLMLVLAPVMCVLSGIAISHLLAKYIKSVDAGSSSKQGVESKRQHKKLEQQTGGVKSEVAIGFVGVITLMLIVYTLHCTWVTSEAYSSPSIVLSARSHDGGRIIFDDFREAYYWLQMNTPEVNMQF
ncbi:GD24643 [Drosophila simulans]|uniref:Dolichyl-diphosphooligosaccharide--protein glycosyltransferase subunit STT3A n=1 Tax=Drosophila simulans TaxID=7240 RepID=B4NTS8_DROSI|nr:GD24643 [Drosophila simulans]